MSTETTLPAVTYVRDIEPGPVFAEGTQNKLWQTEDGRYLVTSWASDHEGWAETMVYYCDETGDPVDPMVYFGDFDGVSTSIESTEPQHAEVLERFGFQAATE